MVQNPSLCINNSNRSSAAVCCTTTENPGDQFIHVASQQGRMLDIFTGGEQLSATLFFIYFCSDRLCCDIDGRDMFSPANPFTRRRRMKAEVAGGKQLISPPSTRVMEA